MSHLKGRSEKSESGNKAEDTNGKGGVIKGCESPSSTQGWGMKRAE